MTISTILASVSTNSFTNTILEVVHSTGKHFGSHIEVLHVRADPKALVPYTGEGMDSAMIEEIMDATERESMERARRVRQSYTEFCDSHNDITEGKSAISSGTTFSWREEIGREDEVISIRGRLFDLIAVGRPVKDSSLPSPITLEAALLDTGRPVLLVPPKPPISIGQNIAVAWESSPEATRAISSALPILQNANKVMLLVRDPMEPPEIDAADCLERLSWSGIKAEILRFSGNEEEIGAAYLRWSKEVGADMLVKGAYGRSRVRQMILGGRTRHIISNADIPVLLSR